MSDTFEAIAEVKPGCQVVIRAPNDVNVIGVVASVDADAQSVTFTDGRTHVFPEPADDELEVTP